jgi:hypothetical protein
MLNCFNVRTLLAFEMRNSFFEVSQRASAEYEFVKEYIYIYSISVDRALFSGCFQGDCGPANGRGS